MIIQERWKTVGGLSFIRKHHFPDSRGAKIPRLIQVLLLGGSAASQSPAGLWSQQSWWRLPDLSSSFLTRQLPVQSLGGFRILQLRVHGPGSICFIGAVLRCFGAATKNLHQISKLCGPNLVFFSLLLVMRWGGGGGNANNSPGLEFWKT